MDDHMTTKTLIDNYWRAETERIIYEAKAAAATAEKATQVRAMRDSGLTWPEIGKLIKTSPQRAQQLGNKT